MQKIQVPCGPEGIFKFIQLSNSRVNVNASVPEELQAYLAYGEEAMASLKEFDDGFISTAKAEWIDTFQRTVNVG